MSNGDRLSEPCQCLSCGNTAPMAIRGHHSLVLKESPDQQFQLLQMWDLLECPVCRKPTLRSYLWMEPDGSPEDVVYQRHYPPEAEVPAALPEPLKRAFLAAERIKPFDANAYGVLVGRFLEMVTTDQGSKKKKLDQALKDIKERGKIPEAIYGIAERLKELRNVGGHAWLGSLTDAEVPIVSELCEALIFHLYVIPSLTSKADAAITALREADRKSKGRGQQPPP